MTLLAFIIMVLILVKLEVRVFKKHILDHVSYTCEFSTEEVFEGEEIELVERVSNNLLLERVLQQIYVCRIF